MWGKRNKKEEILMTVVNDEEIGKGETDDM